MRARIFATAFLTVVSSCQEPAAPDISRFQPPHGTRDVFVSTAAGLRQEITNAAPYTTVHVAAGHYLITDSTLKIEGKTGLKIVGAGQNLTFIDLATSSHGGFEVRDGVTDLTIRSMTITGPCLGPGDHTYGVFTNENESFHIRDVEFTDLHLDSLAIGIKVGVQTNIANGVFGQYDAVSIRGNLVTRTCQSGSQQGVGIANTNATNVWIVGNEIRGAKRHAIYQARSVPGARIVIADNLILDTGAVRPANYTALVVARSSNVLVLNNLIIDPRSTALTIERAEDTIPPWPMSIDIQLVNNTVFGGRSRDFYTVHDGPFAAIGNRYLHTGGARAPTFYADPPPPTPFATRIGYYGAAAVAVDLSTDHIYAMSGNDWSLAQGLISYGADVASWVVRKDEGTTWTPSFQAMAAGGGRVYAIQNAVLHEVAPDSPAPWPYRYRPGRAWTNVADMAYMGGALYIIASDTLFKVNPTDWSETHDPNHLWFNTQGMATVNGRLFVMQANCYHEVKSNLVVTQLSCYSSP